MHTRGGIGLVFHHFGLAVKRPDSALRFLIAQGYTFGESVYDPNQNVRLMMGAHPRDPAVEIISGGEGAGPVDRLVRRHESGVVYHCCYETRNLAETLRALESAGVRCVCLVEPKPAILFGGVPVSFYNVLGMGLIEILERDHDAP